MPEIFQNKAFSLGFIVTILFFLAENIYSAIPDTKKGICIDCYRTYGFPFALYESGTILHLEEFILSGVVAVISIAIFFGIVIGLTFKFISSKISLSLTGLK